MIKTVEFKNFRNLSKRYEFNNSLNIVIGKNNSGKSNLLDGIKLAFSQITGDYFKVSKSDFKNSNDNSAIEINVELEYNSIPSFNYPDVEKGVNVNKCGFRVIVRKTQSSRYVREIKLLNGSNLSFDIISEDLKIPNVYTIPLLRIEDIYTNGLTAGINYFIESEEKYKELRNESKTAIKEELKVKEEEFKALCKEFNQELKLEISDPKISNEKVYIVDGDEEHNFRIGSGYKSIANILLNTLGDNFNIILIDEIENHLHPSLIRTLVKRLKSIQNIKIIATTHSSVVINELKMEEIIDISGTDISFKDNEIIAKKLNTFLHPGRNELLLADNIILVEGYTEELLLRNYLIKENRNWTIINVSGVMFEPYIQVAVRLKKRVVVVSDNDKSTTDDKSRTSRFNNLLELCQSNNVRLIEIDNTLETDLYNNNFLIDLDSLLRLDSKHSEFYVAKEKKKMEIIESLIESNKDLSDWHVIKGIKDEFQSH